MHKIDTVSVVELGYAQLQKSTVAIKEAKNTILV